MSCQFILMLDTSAVNELADDPDREALIAGLRTGYFVRFPFTTVAEIISTTSGARRASLLRVCRRLLSSAGDCLEPGHEIIKIMVSRFERSEPLGLEHVYIRMTEAEGEILRAATFDDDLAAQGREESRISDRKFREVFADAKVAFDRLASSGTKMPASVAELVSQLQQGGAFWKLAGNLYDRVATKPSDDASIRRFYAECEPFRTLMIAIFAAQFDRCIRPSHVGPSLKSGRNDTFMATSLPYCDVFVTNDDRQLACYREVVSVAGSNVKIQSYDEFCNGFSVLGGPKSAAV